jgi:hypothetical protein
MRHLDEWYDILVNRGEYSTQAKALDWSTADEFVSEHVNGLVKLYGQDTVRNSIDYDSGGSSAITSLGRIIEVGGTYLLSRNSYYKNANSNSKQAMTYFLSIVMDRCLVHYLKKLGVYQTHLNNYYDDDTLRLLAQRIMAHNDAGKQDFSNYGTWVYMNHLLQLNDMSYLKWI